MAALVVVAMVAAACTKNAVDTTTTVVGNSPEAKAMIDAALGGTQAVQDFAIYLDLVLMPEEGGLESFYDGVRGQAMAGAGEPAELADGFTLTPVSSLRGGVTDPDGVVLPTISLDFALLEASPALVEEARQSLIAVFETAGEPELVEALRTQGSRGTPLLVQIATADYTERRIHVGLGDRAIIDLTFLDAISPGDRIASVHLFGQTLPGDPAVETGMSALELFVYRWNQGLVAMFGDDLGVATVVDHTSTIAANPTASLEPADRHLSSDVREISVALSHGDPGVSRQFVSYQVPGTMPPNVGPNTIPPPPADWDAIPPIDWEATGNFLQLALKPVELAAATAEAAQRISERVRAILSELDPGGGLQAHEVAGSGWCVAFSPNEETGGVLWALGEIYEGHESGYVPLEGSSGQSCIPLAFGGPETVLNTAVALAAEKACLSTLQELLERNDPSSQTSVGGGGSGGIEGQTDPTAPSSTTTTEPEPPHPLDPPEPEPPDPFKPCDPPDPPPLPKLPLGALLGDVHVKTFDRLAYSNQAAGEFLLFEGGMTTIQMRTEPVEGHDSVSTATAVAVRIGELAVSLHAGGETWIDGELAQLTRGEAIAVGDAALLWWKGGWVVVWPDDTRLEVQDRGSDLAAFVSPSAIPAVGMLGDGDGDPANDLVSRSGDLFRVPPRPSGGYDDAFYDSFYSSYVDSWRITQEESLFHYGPGESTASFTIEGFPARYARVSDLDPQTRVDAEQVCRSGGVTREDVLEDCMLDVGLTGDKGFAYTHYLVESRTEPAVRSPVGAGPATPGDGASIVTVGNLTVDFGPNSPLRDPSRSSRWECFADEGQFRAMSTFAESPTRSFDITVLYGSADTNPTGVESFAIVIRLNAEDHAWTGITIDEVQPFAIENLTLDGNTLTAAGTAYLNDPPLANAFPFVLPEGATAQRFALQATCNQ